MNDLPANPLTVDTSVRISSNTKPLIAALAVALADDGVLALHDPVERFIPELAHRRVVRQLDGDPSDTVAATYSVTVEDLLTMRLGFGFVFETSCAGGQIGGERRPRAMSETGFVAAPGQLPTCYTTSESGLAVFDDASHSRWTRRPTFPDARGGLVSTAATMPLTRPAKGLMALQAIISAAVLIVVLARVIDALPS